MAHTNASRVALCLCGQLRDHFEAVAPALQRWLAQLPEAEVDVFIDVWDQLGEEREKRVALAKLGLPVPVNASDRVDMRLFYAYPRLASLQVEATPPHVSTQLHGLTMPTKLIALAPTLSTGSLPNFWRMHSCSRMVRRWEDEHGFVNGAVVKMRPDSKFFNADLLKSLSAAVESMRMVDVASPLSHDIIELESAETGFALPANLSHQVSDQYAVGTSRAMAYYMDVWQAIPSLWAHGVQNEHRQPLVGEKLVYQHMLHAPFAWKAFKARTWKEQVFQPSSVDQFVAKFKASRIDRNAKVASSYLAGGSKVPRANAAKRART